MPYADQKKQRECGRQWYGRNREKVRERDRQRYADDRHGIRRRERDRFLRHHYGITLEQYEQMIKVQDNKCAICGCEFEERPHMDHCHATGKLRKLLCGTCNKGLGLFRDDPALLRKAAEYLEQFQ